MSAAHKVYGKVAKNQGTFDRDFFRAHKSFGSFINRIIAFKAEIIPHLREFAADGKKPSSPLPTTQLSTTIATSAEAYSAAHKGSSRLRDHDLGGRPRAGGLQATLKSVEVSTSEAESITDTHISSTNTEANTDIETNPNSDKSDTDTGGWLASHKQAHRRAIAQYLATTTDKTPSTFHPSVSTESTAAVTENKASDKDSAAAKNSGSITPRVGSSGRESPHKATFMERCGKVLHKKRSFWKNKEDQKE
ncbi:hypothetical protein F5Y07DRAFT_408424 [Xylaria sp. FL0933]|nr:hypothetical protein F5Y07DRAFT_408424 [Xylaria sp. FL0933]